MLTALRQLTGRAWAGLLLLAGLSLSVVGCGFQLRGSIHPLLPTEVRLFIDAEQALRNALALYLPSEQLRSKAQQAAATLWIGDEQFSQRTLSIDPNTGNESEIELNYSVFFMLQRADGTLWLAKQRLESVRDMVLAANIASRSEEVALLRKAMRSQVMLQIANQVQRALAS